MSAPIWSECLRICDFYCYGCPWLLDIHHSADHELASCADDGSLHFFELLQESKQPSDASRNGQHNPVETAALHTIQSMSLQ